MRTLMVFLAMVTATLPGCGGRYPASNVPVTAREETAALHPAVVTNGDTLEIGFYLNGKAEPEAYRIGVGDVLRVTVVDHPELSLESVNVLLDGTASLALIGSIRVLGMGVKELETVAQRAYARERVLKPRVVVSVVKDLQQLRQFMQAIGTDRGINRIQFSVFDNQPIELPLVPPVAVGRPLDEIREEVRSAYTRLFGEQLGVTVNLAKRAEPTLYVMGEVRRPGSVAMARPTNLLTAIASTGGFSDTADEGAVLVVRFKPDATYDYWTFNLRGGLFADGRPASFPLRGNDVIYVARSAIADANLVIRQYIRGMLPFEVGAGITINP